MVVPNEDTTRQANLSVISDNVEEQTEHLTGEMNPMKTINQKDQGTTEKGMSNTKMMDGNDYDEIEKFYEDIEFDDGSAVDYDLDYTTQA